MEKSTKIFEIDYNKEYIFEYEKMVHSSENSVIVVRTEWSKEGDIFNKLSMYDNNYTPIKTLGSTTLIKPF